MAVDNKIVFGGVDSSTYNIYISGEGVFNAPKRDVEMITIPGRNGAFALDNGRFENITVTYPAFTYETSMATFKQNLANFRNALSAQKGYQRLTDTFHTDEYRMATFIDGLEVKPIKYNTASEFTITFECKPQRWLTSGETKVTIANSGDTITNPTLFDARPMVETTGYGTLTVNGHEVELEDRPLGDVDVLGQKTKSKVGTGETTLLGEWTIDKSQILAGDTLTMDSYSLTVLGTTYQGSAYTYATFSLSSSYKIGTYTSTLTNMTTSGASKNDTRNTACFYGLMPSATFTEGTAGSVTGVNSISVQALNSSNVLVETATMTITTVLSYDGDDKISVSVTSAIVTDPQSLWSYGFNKQNLHIETSEVVGYSTISTLGTPTYIDCDLGICYMVENGNVIDLNKYIDLGSEMPFLEPGSNTILFDNTFTKIEIVPRWWKV